MTKPSSQTNYLLFLLYRIMKDDKSPKLLIKDFSTNVFKQVQDVYY